MSDRIQSIKHRPDWIGTLRAGGPAILLAAVVLVCQIPAQAGTSYVTNGNFSQSSDSTLANTQAINIYGASSNTLTGWTEASTPANGNNALAFLYTYNSQTDAITDTFGTNNFSLADSGAIPTTWTGACVPVTALCGNYIVIDGDSGYNMALQQTLTGLTSGQTYQLTFYEAAGEQSSKTASTTADWQVTLGTSTQTSATVTNPGGSSGGFSGWSLVTMTFNFTGTNDVLQFLAQGAPSGDPPMAFLADVNLTQVTPEPSSLALFGAGVLGLLLARRRWLKRA